MDFDDWMLTKDPKYHPTDDTVALRRLRECWNDAQKYGGQKVGAGDTAKPVAWIRFCSDRCYEGPIMDERMEEVRKQSGAWTPLYAKTHNVAIQGPRSGPAGMESSTT